MQNQRNCASNLRRWYRPQHPEVLFHQHLLSLGVSLCPTQPGMQMALCARRWKDCLPDIAWVGVSSPEQLLLTFSPVRLHD